MKKNCEEFAALLDAFVDGELSPEEALAVQNHLNTCPDCQSYVDDALAIRAAFPTVEDTEVPAGFTEGVMNAIRTQPAPSGKKHHQPWSRVLLPIAACLALVLVLKNAIPASPSDNATPQEAADKFSEARMLDESPTEEDAEAPANDTAPESALDENPEDAAPSTDSAPQTSPAAYNAKTALCSLPESEESAYFARITLTAQEAGNLLDEFTPVSETAAERVYQLTQSDYQSLLEALDAAGIFPAVEASAADGTGTMALVTVLY